MRHPELGSGSVHDECQMLKQVQHDVCKSLPVDYLVFESFFGNTSLRFASYCANTAFDWLEVWLICK